MTTSSQDPAGVRARSAQATREHLLRAAMRRFTVVGYERTTVRQIALDAGVNVSLISRYFGSKDGLFAAVLTESANTLENLRETLPDGLLGAVLAGLEHDAWAEYGGEHPLLLLLRDDSESDRAGELRQRALTGTVGYLAEQLRGTERGDGHLHAELVLALVAGVAMLRTARPDGALATADSERVRSAVERAITAMAARAGSG